MMRSELGETFAGMILREMLTVGPEQEAFLRELSGFLEELERYHYLDAFLGSSKLPPDPVQAFDAIEGLLVELSRDPDNPRALPELYSLAERSSFARFEDELSIRRLEPLVSFVRDVAVVCDFFSPMIDPRDLSFLIYLRWTTEPPRAWYESWPPGVRRCGWIARLRTKDGSALWRSSAVS